MKSFKKLIRGIVLGGLMVMNGMSMEPSKDDQIKAMDPTKIAAHETAIWKLYYEQKYPEAAQEMKSWIEGVYFVKDATELTPLFIQAMGVFGKMPQDSTKEDYDRVVYPLLENLCKQINKASLFQFKDTSIAAHNELDWWVARRLPRELNPENVARHMAQVYANFYGQELAHYQRTTHFRALAARHRDLCQDVWGGIKETDWGNIQEMLALSYSELKRVLEASVK